MIHRTKLNISDTKIHTKTLVLAYLIVVWQNFEIEVVPLV